ncbi:hypothetical protein QVD17_05424 [Tagetes erecta]|uniref:Phytocyanin domain-containing protein n=1 Tax=Tagetes erecta TaxID=13708 RepID=A0AAD8LBY9_TARER|nr:hypothetical protein QVD17_05424 [Tagetes erecta]
MASFHQSLCIFLSLFFTLLCFSQANNFNVGGKDGWTLHPSENYNQWSSRLRFIVNDTLHFKYNSGSDSVLEVSKADYESCNTNSPITSLTGGDSVFNLNRPGPFYFISGNKSNCDQGQKLTVVVISPKTKHTPPAAAPAPTTSSPPAPGTPVSTTPAASPAGGGASSPTGSPIASPGGGIASPPAGGPSASPGGGISSSPTGGPAGAPGGEISSSPTGSPIGSPDAGVSASPIGNPADVNGPAPGGSPASSAARVAVSAALSVPIAMILFGMWWVC